MIKAKNLTYEIPYTKTILQDLSFEIAPGEFLGILGHNGAGKTTLTDLLLGLRKITAGELTVFGEDPHANERKHRHEIGYMSQDIGIKGQLSVRQYLDLQVLLYPSYSKKQETYLLKKFRVLETAKIGTLSLGQQKKVQIVGCLSTCPKLIIIDEMTAVLDPETRAVFFSELERVQKTFNSTVILATNIAEDLVSRAHRILFIKDQKGSLHAPQEIQKLFITREAA